MQLMSNSRTLPRESAAAARHPLYKQEIQRSVLQLSAVACILKRSLMQCWHLLTQEQVVLQVVLQFCRGMRWSVQEYLNEVFINRMVLNLLLLSKGYCQDLVKELDAKLTLATQQGMSQLEACRTRTGQAGWSALADRAIFLAARVWAQLAFQASCQYLQSLSYEDIVHCIQSQKTSYHGCWVIHHGADSPPHLRDSLNTQMVRNRYGQATLRR